MIPSLQEIYSIVTDQINNTMFFSQASRPGARHEIL
jgi:hypothetical protein